MPSMSMIVSYRLEIPLLAMQRDQILLNLWIVVLDPQNTRLNLFSMKARIEVKVLASVEINLQIAHI